MFIYWREDDGRYDLPGLCNFPFATFRIITMDGLWYSWNVQLLQSCLLFLTMVFYTKYIVQVSAEIEGKLQSVLERHTFIFGLRFR